MKKKLSLIAILLVCMLGVTLFVKATESDEYFDDTVVHKWCYSKSNEIRQ